MSVPAIKCGISAYRFTWTEEMVSIVVSGLSNRHDALKGEIKVLTSLPGYHEHLHQASFNFSSTRSKTELTKTLSKVCDKVNWQVLIEQLRVKTMELFRRGDPLEVIDSESEIQEIEYILYPLLPKNQLSLFFGEGGSGKSTFCLLLALMVQIDGLASRYGFTVNGQGRPSTVLYLDWETEKDVINYQFKKLCKSHEVKSKLFYRRCSLPLSQDIETIKEYVASTKADVLIIDSVGIASGGDLNDAQTANSFSSALRTLKTTNLAISHTSKDKTGKKTPFGSVYFLNNSRNVWEVRKEQTSGDDFIDVGLFHRKCNLSKLHNPLGFKLIYQAGSITVENQKVSDVGEFQKELSLRDRIRTLLLTEGILTVREIAERLDTGEQTARSRLNEMRIKGDVVKQGDRFAILYP